MDLFWGPPFPAFVCPSFQRVIQGHEAIALQAALERVKKDVTWLETTIATWWWEVGFSGVLICVVSFVWNSHSAKQEKLRNLWGDDECLVG